jgi:hypothetical protein
MAVEQLKKELPVESQQAVEATDIQAAQRFDYEELEG